MISVSYTHLNVVYGSLIGVGGYNQIDRFVDTVANDRTVFKIGTDFVDVGLSLIHI